MRRIAVGISAGAVVFDNHLGDYRWDKHPSFQVSGGVAWHFDRFAAGVRMSSAGTMQSTGIPGAQSPRVRLTEVDFELSGAIASVLGTEFRCAARTGVLHIGYSPDVVTVPAGIAGAPITVAYEGITEWTAGASAILSRAVWNGIAVSLEAGATTFALDTSHRRGDEIVEERERFVNWDARLGVTWFPWTR